MNTARSSINKLGALVAIGSMCSFVLHGCAAMHGGGSGAADKSDVCGAQQAAFADSEAHYGVSVVEGALIGAALGAGLGALGAAAAHGNVAKGAAIGGGAGAVAGGVGGYFVEKRRTTPDPQALAGAIQSDVVTEDAQIDKATVAFTQLRQCRFAAADQVKSDFAAGRISREEAVRRLDDQRKRFEADVAQAEKMGVKMSDKGKEFQYASDQLVKADPQAQAVIADSPSAEGGTAKAAPAKADNRALPPKSKAVVATAQATQTNLAKAKTFDQDVVQAKADAASQFSLQGTVSEVSRGTEVCSAH